ncbi:unnamed protein product [Lactuca virosa]|uniref:dolichyl-diphosphooligosaccharide--protein glycotransferase n=1 Tax=Lactuca virosa TaxID=75947 RepID=A0AAU9LJ91_9ASTR|nr:unnamed protein product [Lactuca virosa]
MNWNWTSRDIGKSSVRHLRRRVKCIAIYMDQYGVLEQIGKGAFGAALLSSVKLKLQLFPVDETTWRALEMDNHNPHLELTLSTRKKISSVLEHMTHIEHMIPFLCYFKLNCILLHGMLLGRVHLYYQPDTNACASLHCDWSLFISALHCICSTCCLGNITCIISACCFRLAFRFNNQKPVRRILSPKMFKVAATLVISVGMVVCCAVVPVLVAVVASSPTKGWSGRSLSLLDPTYASKYIPIIASVSEHQPPTGPSYFMDLNVLAFLVPAGIIACFSPLSDASSFVILYIVMSVVVSVQILENTLMVCPGMGCIEAWILGKRYHVEIEA